MKRRNHLVLALMAVSMLLAGCGGAHAAAKAVGKQAGAEPVAAAVPVTSTSVARIASAVAKARTSHVDITVDTKGRTISATGDVKGGSSAAAAALSLQIDSGVMGSFEIRLIRQVAFVNLGPLTANKFSRIDLTDAGNPIGAQYGKIIGQLDPTRMIGQLESAVSIRKKGEPVEIDGVEAQPYQVVVEPGKASGLARSGKRAHAPQKVVLTAYIGPDNLPRRFSGVVSGSAATVDFSAWGAPVDITAPQKAEITDKSFLDQFGRH